MHFKHYSVLVKSFKNVSLHFPLVKDDHVTVDLSLVTYDLSDVIRTNFTLFDCSRYNTCWQCTRSVYGCKWCLKTSACIADNIRKHRDGDDDNDDVYDGDFYGDDGDISNDSTTGESGKNGKMEEDEGVDDDEECSADALKYGIKTKKLEKEKALPLSRSAMQSVRSKKSYNCPAIQNLTKNPQLNWQQQQQQTSRLLPPQIRQHQQPLQPHVTQNHQPKQLQQQPHADVVVASGEEAVIEMTLVHIMVL
ncbi:hypothetical protein HELRODRAFT_168392 [Helobdella robusta]|uniref:PSI domain-containing protein n=1 Tax=Helobdella robusta TaxID=6412 RepID=T1F0J3_HELRO|nr:hypothetical protein HELRODRAFT_168392 [Helobdella robusta]ESO09409.1 hypothetical protein HELRODRAFT_168392 [Helobdella robusta]